MIFRATKIAILKRDEMRCWDDFFFFIYIDRICIFFFILYLWTYVWTLKLNRLRKTFCLLPFMTRWLVCTCYYNTSCLQFPKKWKYMANGIVLWQNMCSVIHFLHPSFVQNIVRISNREPNIKSWAEWIVTPLSLHLACV